MIEIMQGSPGSGKSAAAVARAFHHIRKGGVVASNFSLVDGWADVMAKKHFMSIFSDDFRFKHASSMYQRFFRINSISAIRTINPKKLAVGCYLDKGKYMEGSGLLILDEAQLVFNSRKWEKNFDWIEFFTQHRKLGWHCILIAHTQEMIDSQIRPLAEYESRFRNIQNFKLPIIGLPPSPFPCFLVLRRYAGLGPGTNVIADRNLYPLPEWAANLYDSLLVFDADSWGRDFEPSLCGNPPAAVRGTVARQRVSSIHPQCLWTAYEKIYDSQPSTVNVEGSTAIL